VTRLLPNRIILVRHGETAWNKEGRFLGQSDIKLNENGLLQAQTVAESLLQEKIDRILSSDLLRALETSRAIAGFHQVPITITSNLREIDFGLWEGLTFDEIVLYYPIQSSEWLKDPFQVKIPGGETADEVENRVMEEWDNIILSADENDTIVIVAHGGPLRILFCYLTGLELSQQWEFNPGHGEAVILQRTGDNISYSVSFAY